MPEGHGRTDQCTLDDIPIYAEPVRIGNLLEFVISHFQRDLGLVIRTFFGASSIVPDCIGEIDLYVKEQSVSHVGVSLRCRVDGGGLVQLDLERSPLSDQRRPVMNRATNLASLDHVPRNFFSVRIQNFLQLVISGREFDVRMNRAGRDGQCAVEAPESFSSDASVNEQLVRHHCLLAFVQEFR